MCVKNFFAGQSQFYRTTCHHGQFAHNHFMLKRIRFSAKSSTNRSRNYTNLTGRHFQNFGQSTVNIVRSLRGRPKRDPSIGSVLSDGRVLFNRQMRVAFVIIKFFANMVCFCKSGFDVAKFESHLFVNISGIGIFVNLRF